MKKKAPKESIIRFSRYGSGLMSFRMIQQHHHAWSIHIAIMVIIVTIVEAKTRATPMFILIDVGDLSLRVNSCY
jgi:hypothetical protein